MPHFTIRAPEVSEYPQVVGLLNQVWQNPITVEMMEQFDRDIVPGKVQRRQVAVDDNGRVIGYSLVLHHASEPDGHFLVWAATDPDARRQGVGTAVYAEAYNFALSLGAHTIRTDVNDDDEAGLRFAKKRGFTMHSHAFESVIMLDAFDETPLVPMLAEAEASGIRFFSLADEDTEAVRRQLHAVNYRAVLDDPGSSGHFSDYDEFAARLEKAAWFVPEGQIMAADGDEVIGLAAVGYFAHTNSMYNMITGVDRAYRGRKIAQCLKLLTIRVAKKHGADYIATFNDSKNGPMLAINRKLGYQSRSGEYRLKKYLNTPE